MKQNQRRHTIIVGPAGSGKSLRAHELARDHAEHSGIKAVSVLQIIDLYGIERAAQSEPAVLIIDGVLATDARVWRFLADLAGKPTWTLQVRNGLPRRIGAPMMIVTAEALPEGWSAPDHLWRGIDLSTAGRVEAD